MDDSKNDSWLGSLGARYRFAQYDPEQIFEREHTTARAAAANALYIPLMHLEKQMLYPGQTGNNLSAIGIRVASNVGAKNWAARYLRSMTTGYDNFHAFKQAGESCEQLQALAASAAGFSAQGASLSDELQRSYLSPLHNLITHADEAGDLFSQLLRGQLALTPEMTGKLQTHLEAMGDLCQERAAMLRHINKHAAQPGEEPPLDARPADYIRNVMQAREITSPRQLEILFSYVTALIADGAVQLSTEIYIPKDQTFLTPEQSVALSGGVQKLISDYGLVSKDGVMMRKDKDSWEVRPLNLKEVTDIGNQLLRQTQAVAGKESNILLEFADHHYKDIEAKLIEAKHPARQQALPAPSYAAATLSATPWKSKLRGEQTQSDVSVSKFVSHVLRPESRHEIGKLFGRYLPMYALAFPVGIISNILLGFTKTHPVSGKTQWVTRENLMSSLFNLATFPVAESAGVVAIKEAFSFPQSLMIERADKVEHTLAAAIHTSGQLSPELADSMQMTEHSSQAIERLQKHPLFQQVQSISEKSDSAKTPQDYEILQQYFKEMGKVVHELGDKAMRPYRQSEGESLGDVTERVLTRGATNAGEAALAIGFVKAAIHLSKKHVGMLEFEDPSGILLDRHQLKELTDYVDAQSLAAALAPSKDGELIRFNEKSGKYEPIDEENLVRFANVIGNKLTALVPIKKLVSAAKGQLKEEYQAELSHDLFAPKEQAVVKPLAIVKSDTKVGSELTQPWQAKTSAAGDVVRGILDAPKHIKDAYSYAMRPEAHNESNLLLGRMFFTRLLAFPAEIVENIVLGHTKVDQATGQKQWVTAENLKSAIWKLVSFPLVYSFGVVCSREMFMYPQKLTIDSADDAGNTLLAAIHSGTDLAPSLKNTLATLSRSNPGLAELEEHPEFRNIARIAGKPPEARSAQDDMLMEHFFHKTGDAVLTHAARLLSATGDHEPDTSMQEHMQRVLSGPVNNAADATLALAFTQSVLHFNAKHIGVLRYIDPKEMIINTQGVGDLAGYIRTQAAGAGFAVHDGKLCRNDPKTHQPVPVSGNELIRFANVVTSQLRRVVNVDRLAEITQGVSADKYLGFAQKHIFQSGESHHER